MKRQVMQPFKAPRKHNEKASPIRQSPRRQRKQDSEEETELGLVCVPWVINETQYNDMVDADRTPGYNSEGGIAVIISV
jgi:hypothetical protein